MFFKNIIISETLILSVFLILDNTNIANACTLIREDGTKVNLMDAPSDSPVYEGNARISDDEDPGLLYTYETEGITSFDPVAGEESKYLDSTFDGQTLKIFISESYKDWEKNEADNFSNFLSVTLEPSCKPGLKVEFRAAIFTFKNEYDPVFLESSVNIKLTVPLPAGFTIIGDCGAAKIEAIDYDYNSQYMSSVTFSLNEAREDLEVSSEKSDGKIWTVRLETKQTFRIEEPLTLHLNAYDSDPTVTGHAASSQVEITIIPDLETSTPASPVFKEPIHILDIRDEENIGPIQATLIEGYKTEIDVELVYSNGEHLEGFFDANIFGDTITVTPKESFGNTEFSGNFGVLILVAKHRGTTRTGKTVIHVTLPANYVTAPPTSTTEASICTTEPTTVCPPCTTEVVTDCPTETTATCPEVTCATESTTLPCSCPPIITCPEITTHCPEVTDPSEETTECQECTPCPSEDTTSTSSSTSAPSEQKWVHFRDPEAITSIYEQQTGYIKTMSAFCSHECTKVYKIETGPLSDSLFIEHETGKVNVTKNIKDGGHFIVRVDANIEGDTYTETARVHLNVMSLQPCLNGSQWKYSITTKQIQEGLKSPYSLESCDYGDGCECTLENITPEKANDYFTFGREIVLHKEIDREDADLFPDQSYTDIVLQLKLSCESGMNMAHELWNIRSQSVLDEIGNIEYDVLKTVLVLKIGDENDNRPQFKTITSPLTVGYPNAEIAKQMLPPYLTQVQATDIDFGGNAVIKYSLTPNDQFTIHEETGVIYPVAGAFNYKDTHFSVHASDAEGEGEPLEVNVKILSHDNLLVVKKRGSVLEDTDTVLQKISSITKYNIKLLSAAVIARDDIDYDEDGDDDVGNIHRQLGKSTRNPSNSLLRLVIYGLNSREEPLDYSDIKAHLEGEAEFRAESWTNASNSSDGSSDASLLVAVIVLSVILVLVIGGFSVFYLVYVRSKRNKRSSDAYVDVLTKSDGYSTPPLEEIGTTSTSEDKSNPLPNVQFASTTEVTESFPPSPSLPRITITNPYEEISNGAVLRDFDHGTTDDFQSSCDENEKEENDNNGVTRKKSIVTFNDNVERIEIERL
ncbi:uncharacterized protein LOC111871971 isoform X2 [Cryptotermes secundus]|uniref:uncharacterized protein LOC111871971 isoform X2 n=1 Tax=Cryptotermes secundus TaxID=105785 RepID=UPI001454B9D9|nr:uncharacterized protein LOC111871971 isoform X2 [Cryptotermes secundus]